VAGIASDLQQGGGAGLEEQVVDHALVLELEGSEFTRQGEDEVDVAGGQQCSKNIRRQGAHVGGSNRKYPRQVHAWRNCPETGVRFYVLWIYASVRLGANACHVSLPEHAQKKST
jgi:hypothetical protein